MNGEKKKRKTFNRGSLQKVSYVRQEDREADQDEGREKTVHAETAQGREARAKRSAQTPSMDISLMEK